MNTEWENLSYNVNDGRYVIKIKDMDDGTKEEFDSRENFISYLSGQIDWYRKVILRHASDFRGDATLLQVERVSKDGKPPEVDYKVLNTKRDIGGVPDLARCILGYRQSSLNVDKQSKIIYN